MYFPDPQHQPVKNFLLAWDSPPQESLPGAILFSLGILLLLSLMPTPFTNFSAAESNQDQNKQSKKKLANENTDQSDTEKENGSQKSTEFSEGQLPSYKVLNKRFSDVPVSFSQKRKVRIWAGVKEGGAAIDQFRLWISTDFGQSWDSHKPEKQGVKNGRYYLNYTFPKEGVYAVRTTAEDVVQNQEAAPDSESPPQLFIIIDQTSPEISLNVASKKNILPPSQDKVKISWDISDPYLKRESIHIYASTNSGKSWKLIQDEVDQKSSYSYPISELSPEDRLLFKVTARDRLGNAQVVETQTPLRKARSWEGYYMQKKAGFPDLPFAHNSRNLQIKYDLTYPDKKSPPNVILFYTTDGGKTWAKGAVSEKAKSPISFQAPDDGVYGFYLTYSFPYSEPVRPFPKSDTSPDTTTLVDTHPPNVELLHPKAGSTLSPGEKIEIIYKCADAYFPEKPVNLYYSTDGGSVWNVLKKNLQKEGIYNWTVPEEPTSNLRFKVTARDRAGNKTTTTSPGPLFITTDQEHQTPTLVDVSVSEQPENQTSEDQNAKGDQDKEKENKDEEQPRKEEEKEVQKQPEDLPVSEILKKARYYRVRRKYKEAESLYRQIIRIHPSHQTALKGLGNTLYNLSRYGESEAVFQKLLDSKPKSNKEYAQLQYNYGIALYMQEKWDQASDVLLQAIENPLMEETQVQAYKLLFQIAKAYLREDQKEKGLDILTKLQEQDLSHLPAFQKKVNQFLVWYNK